MPLTKDYSFESARLRYRGIERRDAEDIVRWRSDPANYRNFFNARPITMEDHLAWFDGYLKDTKRYDFLIETPDGKPVGTCGLSAIDESGCEISYMIGDVGSRGKGYATEALRALTEVAQSRATQINGAREDTVRADFAREAGYERMKRINRYYFRQEDEKIALSSIEDKSTTSITKDLEIVKEELIANDIEKILYYDLTRPELDVNVVRVIIPGMELYAIDPSRAGYRFLKV